MCRIEMGIWIKHGMYITDRYDLMRGETMFEVYFKREIEREREREREGDKEIGREREWEIKR